MHIHMDGQMLTHDQHVHTNTQGLKAAAVGSVHTLEAGGPDTNTQTHTLTHTQTHTTHSPKRISTLKYLVSTSMKVEPCACVCARRAVSADTV